MKKKSTRRTSQQPILIFDFDGTLADSLTVILNIFHSSRRGKSQRLSKKDIELLRNLTAREVISVLGIPFWRVPRLAMRGRMELSKHAHEIKAAQGLAPVLDALKARGFRMYIMSSNSRENIMVFLKNHGLQKHFRKIYAGIGIFSKARALRMVLAENGLKRENCLYIGDEVRDVQAARKVKIASVAVTWGYNGKEILEFFRPDYLVTDPKQLQKLLLAPSKT